MQAFVRVVEAGSFTAVAESLDATQSTVSKRVVALERHLGVKLLQRSTRRVRTTDEGERYYVECLAILERIEAAESAVGASPTPRGLLRVSCPTALSHREIFPRLPVFLERYPQLRVAVQVTDRLVDLVEEGIDVGIRVGELVDSALIARRIGLARRVLVGAPGYLAVNGRPETPDDLADHACLSVVKVWRFEKEGRSVSLEPSGRLMSNSPEGIRAAVIAGAGIMLSPLWLFGDDVEAGRVEVLLQDWVPAPLPINALYPSRDYVPLKVSAFIEFLRSEFDLSPWVSGYGSGIAAQ